MSAGEVWFFDAVETKNRLHIQCNRFFFNAAKVRDRLRSGRPRGRSFEFDDGLIDGQTVAGRRQNLGDLGVVIGA